MAAKIIAFLAIGGANLAVAVILLFFLMLGLNGFSERDANYAFLFFIGGATVVAVTAGVLGIFLLNVLTGKNFGAVSASLIAIPVFSILGAAIHVALWFGALIVADLARTSR